MLITIFTIITGRKNYIAWQQTRADNQYLVNYHTSQSEALTFDNEAEAQVYISKIFNPHERVFETEPELPTVPAVELLKTRKEKIA